MHHVTAVVDAKPPSFEVNVGVRHGDVCVEVHMKYESLSVEG